MKTFEGFIRGSIKNVLRSDDLYSQIVYNNLKASGVVFEDLTVSDFADLVLPYGREDAPDLQQGEQQW
jgi:hypothetical protein